MNKVIIMGRATKEPAIRQAGETKVANFSIAVDRFKKDDGPDFFNITAFSKLADFAEKYIAKGTKLVICGRLQQNRYEDKEGNKRESVSIIAESVEFAESKKAQEPTETKKDEFMAPADEELPFTF